MTIEKIHFEELFPVGIYANQRLRVEATVSEKDDIAESYKSLKTLVHSAFQAMNPHLYTESGKPITFEPIPETRTNEEITHDQQVQGYFEIIKMVTTQKQLEMHRGNIEKLGDEKLTFTFYNKLQELKG